MNKEEALKKIEELKEFVKDCENKKVNINKDIEFKKYTSYVDSSIWVTILYNGESIGLIAHGEVKIDDKTTFEVEILEDGTYNFYKIGN